MDQNQVTQVVNFLSKVRIEGEIMKGHVINSLNALMMSNDPVSNRFCQVLTESLNRAALTVLNEAAGVPNFTPSVPQQPKQQPTTQMLSESILDHASRLMI